jgi:acetylglutamate synthase
MVNMNCKQLKQMFLEARSKEVELREEWKRQDNVATEAMKKWVEQSKLRQLAYINYQENLCEDD